MKKAGREVLFLSTNENNARNGEGTFLRLRDGRIMYAYTKFGNNWEDHGMADIVALYSSDDGESWGNERIIVEHTKEARNAMCPSLVRLKNGEIGLIYARKIDSTGFCIPHFVKSSDEGETWSCEVVCCEDKEQYLVIENDHSIVMSNGRILIPANHHPLVLQEDGTKRFVYHAKMVFFASDDNGETWYTLCDEYDIPFPETSATGLQETMVYEKNDGSLRAFSRTDMLCQYECSSKDDGTTWSTAKPNTYFTSPASPMLIKRIKDGALAAVFNPIPKYNTRNENTNDAVLPENWGRTPFVLAISYNDGTSFTKKYFLEDDLTNGYCYPSIFDGGDYMLVGYYHSNGSGVPLNSNKIVKIDYTELD